LRDKIVIHKFGNRCLGMDILEEIDRDLRRWRRASLPSRPRRGWLKGIRRALGMSSDSLGRRLQKTGSAVRMLEKSEAEDAITLGSLRRAAEAMGCELQYALVPARGSLRRIVADRAREVALEIVRAVESTMELENQSLGRADANALVRKTALELAEPRRRKELWRE